VRVRPRLSGSTTGASDHVVAAAGLGVELAGDAQATASTSGVCSSLLAHDALEVKTSW
jgi:hypothetical protein